MGSLIHEVTKRIVLTDMKIKNDYQSCGYIEQK